MGIPAGSGYTDYLAELGPLKAENAKLRAALETIAEMQYDEDDPFPHQIAARRALEE